MNILKLKNKKQVKNLLSSITVDDIFEEKWMRSSDTITMRLGEEKRKHIVKIFLLDTS